MSVNVVPPSALSGLGALVAYPTPIDYRFSLAVGLLLFGVSSFITLPFPARPLED